MFVKSPGDTYCMFLMFKVSLKKIVWCIREIRKSVQTGSWIAQFHKVIKKNTPIQLNIFCLCDTQYLRHLQSNAN